MSIFQQRQRAVRGRRGDIETRNQYCQPNFVKSSQRKYPQLETCYIIIYKQKMTTFIILLFSVCFILAIQSFICDALSISSFDYCILISGKSNLKLQNGGGNVNSFLNSYLVGYSTHNTLNWVADYNSACNGTNFSTMTYQVNSDLPTKSDVYAGRVETLTRAKLAEKILIYPYITRRGPSEISLYLKQA